MRAKTTKHRLLAALLSLCMIFSTLRGPAAFAAAAGDEIQTTTAYIEGLFLTDTSNKSATITGTEPFDSTAGDGNDTTASDNIVRTFDQVTYTLRANYQGANNEGDLELSIEATLEKDLTEARFLLDSMKWLNGWRISYQTADGTEVLYEDESGLHYKDQPDSSVSVNDYLDQHPSSDERISEGNPYRSDVVKQVLTGAYVTRSTGASGTQTLSVAIKVLAAKNGDTLEPTFKVFFTKNPENRGTSGEPVTDNTVTADGDYSVRITAAPRYNIRIEKTPRLAYPGYFDLSTGKEANEGDWNGSTVVRGQIVGYGITLELRNGEIENKGLKGLELPTAPITFDLVLTEYDENTYPNKGGANSSSQRIEHDDNGSYFPLLWDYCENVDAHSDGTTNKTGKWGRNLYWNNVAYTQDAYWTAPWNGGGSSSDTTKDSVYNGGTWTITGKQTSSDTPSASTANRTYQVTVNGFDFDFDFDSDHDHKLDDYTFPNRDAGESIYDDNGQNPFSAGYIEVLVQFPKEVKQTESTGLIVEDTNMDSTSIKGTKQTQQVVTDDDTQITTVVLNPPGTVTKRNSFTTRGSESYDTKPAWKGDGEGFLGTYYWNPDEGYDAVAFAGDDIHMWGAIQWNGNNWRNIYAANILQKFDSAMLAVDKDVLATQTSTVLYNDPNAIGQTQACVILDNGGDPTINDISKAKATILYAADPKYPQGYCVNVVGSDGTVTQSEEIRKRMNETVEEDYIYYTSLEALEADGYTCVAILLELRDCVIAPGHQIGLRMPMKVVDDKAYLNQTASTVNSIRIWTTEDAGNAMSKVSWSNEHQQATGTTKATPPDGYVKTGSPWPEDKQTNPNLELDNTWTQYTKAEHKGESITGHTNGNQRGMSLLVVDYKAKVDISVKNTDAGSGYTDESTDFDVQNGELNATFKLTGISTEVSKKNASTKDKTTNLTITVSLPEQVSAKNGISMNGAYIPYGGEGTTVTFTDSAGKTHTITVSASVDENGNVVIEIKGAPLGIDLPDIEFDAVIDRRQVNHNDNLKATTVITGDGDQRAYTETAGNNDEVGLTITKNGTTAVYKAVDQDLIEVNGEIDYHLTYETTIEVTDGVWIYDILPYNGDSRQRSTSEAVEHSSFHGTLDVLSVIGEDIPAGTIVTVYYTTTPVSGNETIFNLNSYASDNGLTQENFAKTLEDAGFEAAASVLDGQKPMIDLSGVKGNISCLFFYVSAVPDDGDLTIGLHLKTDGNEAADAYYNDFHLRRVNVAEGETTTLPSNVVETEVISRTISGLAWLDQAIKGIVVANSTDADGLQTSGEKPISGIKVSLIDQSGNVAATTTTGEWVNLITGETGTIDVAGGDAFAAGRYEFRSVPAGTYSVKFESGETDESKLAQYTASPVDQGNNDEIDSDGVPNPSTGILEYTLISNIEMMTLDAFRPQIEAAKANGAAALKTAYTQVSPYHDSGFYLIAPAPGTGSLTVRKAVTGALGDTEKEFHFTVTLSDTSINGTYGDMTFVSGVAKFALKDGESRTATGLPAGITYTAAEIEANQDGYTTSVSGESGTISDGGHELASFTNDKPDYPPDEPDSPPDEPEDPPVEPDSPPVEPDDPPDTPDDVPKTGDNGYLELWTFLMVSSVIGLLGVGFFSNRKRKLFSTKGWHTGK